MATLSLHTYCLYYISRTNCTLDSFVSVPAPFAQKGGEGENSNSVAKHRCQHDAPRP